MIDAGHDVILSKPTEMAAIDFMGQHPRVEACVAKWKHVAILLHWLHSPTLSLSPQPYSKPCIHSATLKITTHSSKFLITY